ncbi:MBL fold metallo-hydrolase [Rhodococcus aetherivorans]|uniref:MBL fold metallo-hydrolase n=2 Tax=Nocardiaceae TaxID=85025 RepID=UPI0002D21F75|nr:MULTISPECIES: MBL fold metallo-hydrolase [Rhodococcus]USC15104.1 MBL fold metallo-hydrolase [Rhodococcus sp. 11-3]WKW98469.1 MBL fold metallo-hydrolase [Rhodococcus aetherivorans]CCW13508.1 Fumarylacetoacetase [Rhodococcus aetherivorans]
MGDGGLTQIGDGVWAVVRTPGGWGEANTGLVVDAGTASLVVDTAWDTRLARRIAEAQQLLVSRAPITEAVNTHSDGDHWWGNDTLPATARITTSAAALRGMREDLPPAAVAALAAAGRPLAALPGMLGAAAAYMRRVPGGARLPLRSPRLPDHTFDTVLRLDVGQRPVQLERLGPCHTAGDLIAHVSDAGIVFAGDLLFIGSTPILWHGPLENWLAAIDRLLALDADLYVPGHGPLCGPTEIRELRAYWVWLEQAGREQYARGAGPLEAARQLVRDPEFVRWGDWIHPERIVLSLSTLFYGWDGHPPAAPTVVRRARAFADAETLLRELSAKR